MSRDTSSAQARFPVGLEQGRGGATVVHAFSVPGCMAAGGTKEEALEVFGTALGAWLDFLAHAGEPVPDRNQELEIAVEEWIVTDADVDAGESSVRFEADRPALGDAELLRGVRILGRLRARLLPHVRRARNEDLEKLGPPGWNARVILDELARAQWWTLTRLGWSPLAEVPGSVVGRLDTAMALVVQHLAHLPADRRALLLELDGEEWTPRKVLRRLLWLEWSLGGAALHALSAGGGGGHATGDNGGRG
jgi:predicted RNase H-like HicB family nuclease